MKTKTKEWVVGLILIASISFLLNFLWESIHSVYLYANHDFLASKYVPIMLGASLLDAVIVMGICLIVALLWKDILWYKKLSRIKILVFLGISFSVGILIEIMAINMDIWTYNSLMPQLFDIGISPFLQLGITGLISLLVFQCAHFLN